MANLFDIANLITTVGVDAVKIKPEPGLPEKTSNEILTELFNTFETEQGISPDDSDVDSNGSKSEKSSKKKKKKHKHHKEKKHKQKKSKHDQSSESNSDNESNASKKKKKHKKKSKRKHEDRSSKSSDIESSTSKIPRLSVDESSKLDEFEIFSRTDALDKIQNSEVNNKADENDKLDIDGPPSSPLLPSDLRKTTDENDADEPVSKTVLEKPKSTIHGKIQIKDLKNSAVYNKTVKEIENKEKEKKSRMEEGEISDSDGENSAGMPDVDSPSYPQVKDDLRLLLKEKEKKKSSDDRHSRSKTVKGRSERKDGKSEKKGDKRSSSLQSRGRRKSTPPSRSRSRHSKSRDRERDRYRERSRERRDRDRSYERWDKRKYDGRHRSRSNDKSKDRYRGRSRSRERKERIEIDKKKLLEIARRNAINMIKQGTLPLAQQNKVIAAIQAGGKTVDELTDFCKSLSKSEALGELSSISDEGDSSSSEKGFHHPFLLKERPMSIIMNIRDSKQLPTKTFQEKTAESSSQLRLQFPVSSGQYHRKTENEWVPVTPKKPEPTKKFIQAAEPLKSVVPVPVPPVAPVEKPAPPVTNSIFPQPAPPNVDIGSIVSKRLAAMRKLSENPHDVQALNEMYQAQNGMRNWAESKQMPGQFVGTTGAKVLTPAELSSGYQAWARKDQLLTAQPVSGGMGMALLQKMGWRPGEGLGKNKEGTLEPLQLEVKLDKKGLVSDQDVGVRPGKNQKPVVPTVKTLEGKHPVSLLGEFCSKRKWGAPVYELCFECGPDHRKNFLFKVKVNGTDYQPTVASPNKKQAKAEAAQICLQSLGLLPNTTAAPEPV